MNSLILIEMLRKISGHVTHLLFWTGGWKLKKIIIAELEKEKEEAKSQTHFRFKKLEPINIKTINIRKPVFDEMKKESLVRSLRQS